MIKITETVDNQEYEVIQNGRAIFKIRRVDGIWKAFTPDGKETLYKSQYRHDLFDEIRSKYGH